MSPARFVISSAFLLSLAPVVACSESADDVDTSESALSGTRSRVIPADDASRDACRTVAQRVFCSEAEARAALASCAPKGSRAVTVETRAGSCAASGLAYLTLASCEAPLDTDCSYYSACLERAVPCGKEGYALGFGEKYCTKFRAASLSPAGKRWVTRVMSCLQRALVPDVLAGGSFASGPASASTCKEVFDRAFHSHPACYTAKESSICALPPADLATIVKTIGLREILTVRTGSQMATTAGICIGQLTERLFGGGSTSASVRGVTPKSVAPAANELDSLSHDELEQSLEAWKALEAGDDAK